MKKFFSKDIGILFLPACIISFFLVVHISYQILQEFVLLLALLLIFMFLQVKKIFLHPNNQYRNVILFISTFFIELLIIATGGFASHFFLLLFLFSISISFFLNFTLSLIFVFSFIVLLVIQVSTNYALLQVLKDDPGLVMLLVVALIIIGILNYLLSRAYHIKDSILEIFKRELLLKSSEEQLILENIREYIIITDKNFSILSTNTAFDKTIILPKTEIIKKKIFDVLNLTVEGQRLSEEDTAIKAIVQSKAPHVIENVTVGTTVSTTLQHYSLHIEPIMTTDGTIDQLIFIFSS